MIVGGYRRGKEACGDVDIVVSHPDEAATHNIVEDIVASLEEDGWITHTLTLALNNSKRGQQTLPFHSGKFVLPNGHKICSVASKTNEEDTKTCSLDRLQIGLHQTPRKRQILTPRS